MSTSPSRTRSMGSPRRCSAFSSGLPTTTSSSRSNSLDALALRNEKRSVEDRGDLRIVEQVTLGEPARLLGQAKEPLEPGVRHPSRCATHRAGDEIEPRADADGHRGLDRRKHPLDEELL